MKDLIRLIYYVFLVVELLADYQLVAFLTFQTSFFITFRRNCGRADSLINTTCLESVVRGKQEHVPCKILLLRRANFLCQSNLMETAT